MHLRAGVEIECRCRRSEQALTWVSLQPKKLSTSHSNMPKLTAFAVRDIYTISGTEIATIYEKNRMAVHFQGMSKTLQFPQTVALQGAPTCSIGISPYGFYNRLNDAGRLIMLNQKAVQFGSVPFVRLGDQLTMLTQAKPGISELPDDVPAIKITIRLQSTKKMSRSPSPRHPWRWPSKSAS